MNQRCKLVNTELKEDNIELLENEYRRLYPKYQLKKEMLGGLPTSSITMQRDVIKDPCTGRKIEYSTSTAKQGSIPCQNSFVALNESTSIHNEHTFTGCMG